MPQPSKKPKEQPPPAPAAGKKKRKRPERRAEDRERKRFMTGAPKGAQLAVTIADGVVAKRYAPFDVVTKVASRAGALLQDVGGGQPPMFYGASGGASMRLFFGDPIVDSPQGQLPIEVTRENARRISSLIEAGPDEVFQRATAIGRPALHYVELTHLVESYGIDLFWEPAEDEPVHLDPARAVAHRAILEAEPKMVEREIAVNGTLYRVIADRKEGRLGTIGLDLFDWSTKPRSRGKLISVPYADARVEAQINEGLIGQPVAARLLIREPRPGTSVDPSALELVVLDMKRGAPEDSIKGPRLPFDAADDDDDVPF